MIIKNEIHKLLYKTAQNNANEVVIVSPFISYPTLTQLLDQCSKTVKLTLITKDDPWDYACGYNSIDAWHEIWKRNGNVYLCRHLHAKYYRFDDIVFIGSCNLTDAGLGLNRESNIELITQHPFDSHTHEVENSLLKDSILISFEAKSTKQFEVLVNQLREDAKAIQIIKDAANRGREKAIFQQEPSIKVLNTDINLTNSSQNLYERPITAYPSGPGVIDLMTHAISLGHKIIKDNKKVTLFRTPHGMNFVLLWDSLGLKRDREADEITIALDPKFVDCNSASILSEGIIGQIRRHSNMRLFPKDPNSNAKTAYGIVLTMPNKERLFKLLENYDKLALYL